MWASMRPGRQVNAERSSDWAPTGAAATTVRPSMATVAFVFTLFVAGSRRRPARHDERLARREEGGQGESASTGGPRSWTVTPFGLGGLWAARPHRARPGAPRAGRMNAVREEMYAPAAGGSRDDELLAPPADGGWSAAEVLDHLRPPRSQAVKGR